MNYTYIYCMSTLRQIVRHKAQARLFSRPATFWRLGPAVRVCPFGGVYSITCRSRHQHAQIKYSKQCFESVSFLYGSGSSDAYSEFTYLEPDPDPTHLSAIVNEHHVLTPRNNVIFTSVLHGPLWVDQNTEKILNGTWVFFLYFFTESGCYGAGINYLEKHAVVKRKASQLIVLNDEGTEAGIRSHNKF